MTKLRKKILWVDGSGGLLVGLAVLILLDWLTQLHGLPRGVLAASGIANVSYGAYSLSLAWRAIRPAALIRLLVAANLTWALVCFTWTALYYKAASFIGVGHLVLEGVYVGGLACLEWRWRGDLRYRN